MKRKTAFNKMVYILLKVLVVLCMIIQLVKGHFNNVFICILTLILFEIPKFINKTLKLKLTPTLEIMAYFFIFAAQILGEIKNFYEIFPNWDTILHAINGFLMGAFFLSLINVLNKEKVELSPLFISICAFCFSMTIGILWEFCEYSLDKYFYKDCQKDTIIKNMVSEKINNKEILSNVKTEIYTDNRIIIIDGYLDIGLIDTMEDLFVNFLGAVIFSYFCYFYILDNKKYKFLEIFISKSL